MDDPWGSPWVDEVNLVSSGRSEGLRDEETAQNVHGVGFVSEESSSAVAPSIPWDQLDGGENAWADNGLRDTLGAESSMGKDDTWKTTNADITTQKDPGMTLSWNDPSSAVREDAYLPENGRQLYSLAPLAQKTPDSCSDQEHNSTMTLKAQSSTVHSASVPDLMCENETCAEVGKDDIAVGPSEARIASSTVLTVLPQQRKGERANVLKSTRAEQASSDMTGTQTRKLWMCSPTSGTDLQGVDPASSRPSSSPSEESSPVDALRETPRSSLDEEAPTSALDGVKSSVSKVQNLVQHFDGLTKQRLEDGPRSPRVKDNVSLGELTSPYIDEDNDSGDFGDFEEGFSDAERDPHAPDSTEPKKRILARAESSVGSKVKGQTLNISRSDKFQIDLNPLWDLFSDSETATISTQPANECSNSNDSTRNYFATAEEPKTWYRISREGTMRKHNRGDDDNYVRISWVHSNVRDEVLRIVSRWMKKDRINARMTCGDADKVVSIFGWNATKATPVPPTAVAEVNTTPQEVISQSFPEVSREWPADLIHDRSRSLGSSKSKSRQQILSNGPSTNLEATMEPQHRLVTSAWGAGSMDLQPEPSIWDSDLSAQIVSHIRGVAPSQALEDIRFSSPWEDQLVEAFPVIATNSTSLPAQVSKVAEQPLEEDEWGDMVSSFQPTESSILSITKGSHQSSLASFDDFYRPTTASAAVHPKSPTLQTGHAHEPPSSFDQAFPPECHTSSLISDPAATAPQDSDETTFDHFHDGQSSTKPRSFASPTTTTLPAQPMIKRIRAPSVTFDEILGCISPRPSNPQAQKIHLSMSQKEPSATSFDEIFGSKPRTKSINEVPTPLLSLENSLVGSSPNAPSSIKDQQIPSPPRSTYSDPWVSLSSVGLSQLALAAPQGSSDDNEVRNEMTISMTSEEMKQNEIVQGILSKLPNLDYMFRR